MHAELKVFVVDDDDAVRDSLTVLIESAGFKVEAFASAEEFIERREPTWRGCMLVDVRMPGMNGLELQRRLKKEKAMLSIIFMTGHGNIPMVAQAMKLGAVDFFEKPYREEELLEGVRLAMENVRCKNKQGLSSGSEAATLLERLTLRERDVFEQLVMGASNKVVARALGISPRTVEIHRARVMEKLQLQSLAQLIKFGIATGVDTPVRQEDGMPRDNPSK